MSLGNAIAWQFVCAAGYSAAILALGGEGADLFSVLVNEWVLLANRFVRTVTFFLPEPPHAFGVLGLDLYQHILVFSLLIAGAWLWMLRRHWDSWASELYPAAIGNARTFRMRQDLLRYYYRMMVLGALAAIVLLLFLSAGSDAAKSWLVTERWTYLRAPLLVTACFAFVCHAIAVRRLLEGARHFS